MELFFEDVSVGQRFQTGGRTITEADVVAFAALSGDWNAIHTDAEVAAASPFGQRIAHGLLGLAVATGLTDREGWFRRSGAGLLEMQWKYQGPILLGDTISCAVEFVSKRLTSKGDRGVVERSTEVINQRGEVVQSGVLVNLLWCRARFAGDGPADGGAAGE